MDRTDEIFDLLDLQDDAVVDLDTLVNLIDILYKSNEVSRPRARYLYELLQTADLLDDDDSTVSWPDIYRACHDGFANFEERPEDDFREDHPASELADQLRFLEGPGEGGIAVPQAIDRIS